MVTLIAQRFFFAVVTVILVSIITYVSIEAMPGDICTSYWGREATPERLDTCREQRGLYRPVTVRFVEWAEGALQGDLGLSLVRDTPISSVIPNRLRNTMVLGAAAGALGISLAVTLGIIAGLTRDRPPDIIISTTALMAMTLPEFVTATILILVFSVNLGWFPAIAIVGSDAPVTELLPILPLPVITLTLVMVAHILRMVRTNVINVMTSDYVQNALMRGLKSRRVVLHHALPSAMLPAINIIGLTMAWLLTGTVIVEQVFNYPGLGTMLIGAISDRDLPMVQAGTLILAIMYISANLITDLLALFLNPRLRTFQN